MNPEQKIAFESVKKRNNIFITGSAGCGKSFVLQNIVNWARSENKQIAITASTGSSAYLIKGRTIHSYLGIGLAKKTAKELADNLKAKKSYSISKLKSLDILIIDEISMIHDELLDKISDFLSIIRNSTDPFGNIQIIFCGDFCQLPPVEGKYCFLSKTWQKAKIQNIILTQQMRQKNEHFIKMLDELRFGICTPQTFKTLKNLKNNIIKCDIIPTILFSTNVDVDKINKEKFNDLIKNGAIIQTYKTKYSNNWSDNYKIPEIIELCLGAQVVLTWNIDQDKGLINGSRGIVTEITPNGPRIKFISGKEIIIEMFKLNCEDNPELSVTFMPLRLAWATTIHKSQGMTLDAVVVDLGKSIFQYGQAYTALSRAKDLDSVIVQDISINSFKTHKDVLEFYKSNF